MQNRTVVRSVAGTIAMAIALGVAVGTLLAISGGGSLVDMLALSAVSSLYGALIGIPTTLAFRYLKTGWARRSRAVNVLASGGAILGSTLVGSFVTRVMLMTLGVIDADDMWTGFVQGLEISLAIAVPCTAAALAFAQLSGRLAASEAEKQRALVLAAEARLASLESRIRPHFLFNALNSAIALIPEDPRRAEDVLERLSSLLRFSLDTHLRLVSLATELRMVEDYLEIERVRFGARLVFELDVADPARAAEIPAFAIQTLVENSVKYAVGARSAGARVVVRARVDGGRLSVTVADDGPGFSGDVWRRGHGLDSLRDRLDALYGASAHIAVGPTTPGADVWPGATVAFDLPVQAARSSEAA